jgi:hypothetical protein
MISTIFEFVRKIDKSINIYVKNNKMKKIILLLIFLLSCLINYSQIIFANHYYSGDNATSLVQTPDNGYLVCGYTSKLGVPYDLYLMKIDEYGVMEWDTTFGIQGYDYGINNKILKSYKNSYLVTNGGNQIWEIDELGNILNIKSFDDLSIFNIKKNKDSTYVIYDDSKAAKLDTSLNKILEYDLYSLQQTTDFTFTSDTGFVYCSIGICLLKYVYYYMQKYDKNYNLQWEESYVSESLGDVFKVIEYNDSLIVVGESTYNLKSSLLRFYYTNTGDIYNVVGVEYGNNNYFDKTIDDEIISCGVSENDFMFNNFDINGVKFSKIYNTPDLDFANYVQKTSDNGYIICGKSGQNYAYGNIFIIKTDNNGNTLVDIQEEKDKNSFKIYPNPTNGIINIDFLNRSIKKIIIYNITGKQMSELTGLQLNKQINLSSLEKGIYIISIQTENEIFTEKIIKE